MKFSYLFNNGKNPKWKYYAVNGLRLLVPAHCCNKRLKKLLSDAEKRKDYEYIKQRVDYYNKLTEHTVIPPETEPLSALLVRKPEMGSVYFFDAYEFTRYFPQQLKCNYIPGDITQLPSVPSILKSRPLSEKNQNGVLFKLNKIRHFIFLNDKIPFEKKRDAVIFRGKVEGKPNRIKFMEMYFNNPLCDLGDISRSGDVPQEWKTEKKTLCEHLEYKFIMSLEGVDVASNLKWIMSSNSIAVMPKPCHETWFMEGTLIPGYHYIEIKPDFSDLEERLNYYIQHPQEARKIIKNAQRYVEQFKDKKREKLISLLVLQKYFKQTDQL